MGNGALKMPKVFPTVAASITRLEGNATAAYSNQLAQGHVPSVTNETLESSMSQSESQERSSINITALVNAIFTNPPYRSECVHVKAIQVQPTSIWVKSRPYLVST